MDGVNNTAGTFSPENGGATGSGNAPSRGSLGGRRVPTAPGQESPARSPVIRRRELPEAGASAEARGRVPLSKRALPAPRSVPAHQAALPGPATSSAEPPGRATATADTVSVPQNPGTAAGREPLPRPVDLPWLNPSRNAALATAPSRLQALLERRDLPDSVKQHLSRCFEVMTRAERDIVRVDALLRRTALEKLTLAERTELERMVLSIRKDLARGAGTEDSLRSREGGMIQIQYLGAWYDTVREAARDLLERHYNAREYFYSANVPWEPAIRRLAIMKAAQTEVPVTVERRPVPLGLPGSQPRIGDCPALGHAGCIIDAPDCTHTAMTDANGRVLYTGISHSLIQPRLTKEEAAMVGYADSHGLPIERVRAEVERLCSHRRRPVLHLAMALRDLDLRCRVQGASDLALRDLDLRCRVQGANDLAWRDLDRRCGVQGASGRFTILGQHAPRGFALANAAARRGAGSIARAVAAQALQSDPEKLARACNGEIVDIELLAIPTLHYSDTFDFIPQCSAFEALEKTPLALSTLDHKGHVHIVRANVRFQHIPVKIGEALAQMAFCVDSSKLVKWLGPMGDRELSGKLSARIDAMKTRVSKLRSSMIGELPSIRPANKPLPEFGPAPNELRKLGEDSAYLERNLRMLEQAGMDFKGYVRGRIGMDADDESVLDGVARVALVAHLSGRTPVLCCPAGSDTVERVESRIESLLRFAGAHEGNLPILLAQAVRQETARAEPTLR